MLLITYWQFTKSLSATVAAVEQRSQWFIIAIPNDHKTLAKLSAEDLEVSLNQNNKKILSQ